MTSAIAPATLEPSLAVAPASTDPASTSPVSTSPVSTRPVSTSPVSTSPASSPSASPAPADGIGRGARWTGRVLSGIAVLFLLFDGTFKLFVSPEAVKGTMELGYAESVLRPLGIVQLICLAVYLVPRTSVLGAVLWTGYLGGAIATHVRVGNPWASHTLFPVYIALLLWGGLWLRDRRVRAILPVLGR